MASVQRTGDHECYDDTEQFAHAEDDGVAPELGIGRFRGGGRSGWQLDSDVQP
jgi:hypothetical protein